MGRYISTLIFLVFFLNGFTQIDLLKNATNKLDKLIVSSSKLTQKDKSEGLKEALIQGVNYAANKASLKNEFYTNKLIFIPFPDDALILKSTLLKLGMNSQVLDFEKSINYAAELASAIAKEVIIKEIRAMNISDAFLIINGEKNAATEYLRLHTYERLFQKFKQIVINTIKEAHVTRYWGTLIKKYNSIPFTRNINVDLEDYITEKTIEGLFILIAQEELNIRSNPNARLTPLIKKVFQKNMIN